MSAPSNTQKHQVLEDVFLYVTKQTVNYEMVVLYEVECHRFNTLFFGIDFTNSENFSIEGNKKTPESMLVEAVAQPFERVVVARLMIEDKKKKAVLKTKYQVRLEVPDQAYLEKLVGEENSILEQKIVQSLQFNLASDSASVAELENICQQNNIEYLDPDFPPWDESIFLRGPDGTLQRRGKKFVWYKPAEFFGGNNYSVFAGGIEPNDIRQGQLGDCWVLSAVAGIAEFPQLVHNLFSPESHNISQNGVYRLRFCKNGEWQEVTVDDYFPCYPKSGPAFSRSNGNELWVLLLEKAYAKLHGSYEAIRSGRPFEAMIDFTGAPFGVYRFQDPATDAMIKSGELWRLAHMWDQQGHLMSVSTAGNDDTKSTNFGLVQGHAYTLLQVHQTSQGHRLVKIRNPWGNFEWNGDWSDKSLNWTPEIINEVNATFDEHDGVFWMNFDDMIQNFSGLNVVMSGLTRPMDGSAPWREVRRKVTFSRNTPDQSVKVDLFQITVDKPTRMYFSIHQEDTRILTSLPYIEIGVTILQLKSDGGYEVVASSGEVLDRQNQTEAVLEPGVTYIVVPTTLACKLTNPTEPSDCASTPIRIFVNDHKFSHEVRGALNHLFRKLDRDTEGTIDRAELNEFMKELYDQELTDEQYQFALNNCDVVDGCLTFGGFQKWCLFLWREQSEERIWQDLAKLGYSRSLKNTSKRTCVIAFHGESDFAIRTLPFDSAIYRLAMELALKKYGTCQEFADGKIKLYVRKAGCICFAVENCNPKNRLKFALDCGASVNVASNESELKVEKEITSCQLKDMMFLVPADSSQHWSWTYRAKMSWLR